MVQSIEQKYEDTKVERKAKDLSKAKDTFRFPEVGETFLCSFTFFIGYEEEGIKALKDYLGSKPLRDDWPKIIEWIKSNSGA
jgi:hypothetical protein